MEYKKIDKLFRNKLYGHESVPSQEAWSRLEGMLDDKPNKNTVWLWRVAGMAALLITSVFVYLQTKSTEEQAPVISAVEYVPSKQVEQMISSSAVIPSLPQVQSVVVHVELAEAFEERSVEVVLPEPIILDTAQDITPKAENSRVIVLTNQYKKEPVDRTKPVRITYKRGGGNHNAVAKNQADTTRQGIFKKLEPDQLWADMRDAKDRMISNAFDFKRKNVKNSNKEK
jgi:hypothetical protein